MKVFKRDELRIKLKKRDTFWKIKIIQRKKELYLNSNFNILYND